MQRSCVKFPLVLIGLLLANASAWAQETASASVQMTSQVTEEALVAALMIDVPDEPDRPATRAFRPAIRLSYQRSMAASGPQPPRPAAPGKFSLLLAFANGSAELTPETKKVLETVARALNSDHLAGFAFRIEGHTDPSGGVGYNLKLSQKRAESVAAYLSGRLGILRDRLQAVGKGSTELLNPGKPDAQENRRVSIVTVR